MNIPTNIFCHLICGFYVLHKQNAHRRNLTNASFNFYNLDIIIIWSQKLGVSFAGQHIFARNAPYRASRPQQWSQQIHLRNLPRWVSSCLIANRLLWGARSIFYGSSVMRKQAWSCLGEICSWLRLYDEKLE